MSWSSRASRARGWSGRDWLLLAEGWLAVGLAGLAVRRWPMPEVLAWLQRAARPAGRPVEPEPVVRAVQRAVHLHPWPLLCLPQSVAITWMLARRGFACELVIGARPKADMLDAHAWVEQRGIPLNSPPDSAESHPVLLRQAIP